MEERDLYALLSLMYFKYKNVDSFNSIKVSDMSDSELVTYCHWYYMDNDLYEDFLVFQKKIESEYYYCPYLKEYIEPGLCYDLQIFSEGYVETDGSVNRKDDSAELAVRCMNCCYGSDKR